MFRRAGVAALVLAGALVGIGSEPAWAATRTWRPDGGAGFWSRAENWAEGTAPADGDALVFPAGGDCGSNDVVDRLDLAGVRFDTNCQVDGEAVGLGAGGMLATAPSGHTVGFLLPVTLLADQAWGGGPADILVDDTIDFGGHTLTLDSPGRVVLAWTTGAGRLVKRGSGSLYNREGTTSTVPLEVRDGTVDHDAAWDTPVFVSGGRLRGSGSFSVIEATGGTISTGHSFEADGAGRLMAGRLDLRAGSTLTTPTRHGRLVAREVSVGGARLEVGFATNNELRSGDRILVIENTGSAPVAGTFAGVPEGSIVWHFSSRYRVTYRGGDGNDVELEYLDHAECDFPDPWPPSTVPVGYRFIAADGGVFAFGDHGFAGSAPQTFSPVVGIAGTPTTHSYWEARADGSVLAWGSQHEIAQTTPQGPRPLAAPVVGIATAPRCRAYWLATSAGQVFNGGLAGSFGEVRSPLNRPIVGIAATPTGRGYWLVASDGGLFAFGDAGFFGSTGDIVLNKPIVGMAATPSGNGYWLVASDGGIFAFGDAGFFGSTGDIVLNKPIVGMARTGSGTGYWLVAADGGVFAFGDAPFLGSTGDITLNSPIVGVTA